MFPLARNRKQSQLNAARAMQVFPTALLALPSDLRMVAVLSNISFHQHHEKWKERAIFLQTTLFCHQTEKSFPQSH